MEPVDPNEAPDYYKVIKEPMGTLFLIVDFFGKLKLKITIFHFFRLFYNVLKKTWKIKFRLMVVLAAFFVPSYIFIVHNV